MTLPLYLPGRDFTEPSWLQDILALETWAATVVQQQVAPFDFYEAGIPSGQTQTQMKRILIGAGGPGGESQPFVMPFQGAPVYMAILADGVANGSVTFQIFANGAYIAVDDTIWSGGTNTTATFAPSDSILPAGTLIDVRYTSGTLGAHPNVNATLYLVKI